ncbi:MAG: P-II family nitrogen regulator [Gemmatimonadetes bacterium]|nr:P-II family nitrogen regulator [Gemmatimonadota bacterium]MBT8404033.1 P-II family nitrogen regulator [Gemmatimonadota bacterium]NNK63178.1 P-II family nitrogen regulator [Gemmatimonadota bacterium]
MKMILTYLPPYRLDRVTRALEHVEGFTGMTVTPARGFGREKLEDDARDVRDQLDDFTPTVRVEAVVSDDRAEAVVQAVLAAAHTGARGDGKIFVLPVEDGVRIKTKARGPRAV